MIVKFLVSFVILIVLMYGMYYYLNRIQKGFTTKGRNLHIVESKMVGKNKFIFLMHVKDATLLVASDESGIKILKEWKRNEDSEKSA